MKKTNTPKRTKRLLRKSQREKISGALLHLDRIFRIVEILQAKRKAF